jgi:hypothetical protein
MVLREEEHLRLARDAEAQVVIQAETVFVSAARFHSG